MGLNDLVNSAKNFVSENGDDLIEKAKDLAEQSPELVNQAKDTATNVANDVKGKLGL